MNFEDKKQEIIDELNEINASCEPMQYGQYSWLFDKISELKPDYPTCSTCGYCNKVIKFGHAELYCEHPEVNNDPAEKDFGCNKHSGLESEDETH